MVAVPENPIMDARVQARRQKDLEGFLEKYQKILDKRAAMYAKEIGPTWNRITNNIVAEIEAIYNEIQDAQGVPIVKQPIQADKYNNMQRQLNRLGKLLETLVEMLGIGQLQEKLENNLVYTYTEAYYFNAFGVEQAAKVAVQSPMLTYSQVMGVISNPWLPDGNTYSDRLRANTAYLALKMTKTVENAVGSGWSINRTAREIQNNAQEGFFNSVRLARTEINRAASQGASHLYMQNADLLDSKRWNATLDSRTAPKDADNDGKTYPLNYDTVENPGKPGERIPNHPNCRCKYSPVLSVFGGKSVKERIARGAGDTRDNFGERTYTKAQNYREYANERGLPDLDERLRNDDPRKYLRRGEKTLEPIPKRVNNKRKYKEVQGYVAKLHKGSQDKHILGTPNFKQELNNGKIKSIVYGNHDTIQKLLDDYAGTGSFLPKRPNVERVSFNHIIGEYFDANDTKLYYETSNAMIHYSKAKGAAHIVPARPDEMKGGKTVDEKFNRDNR